MKSIPVKLFISFISLFLSAFCCCAAEYIWGKAVQVSALPATAQNAYPDCNYTVKFSYYSNLKKDQEILLVVPGFRQRKNVPGSDIAEGDFLRVLVMEESAADGSVKSIEIADDIGAYDLDTYYAVSVEKVKKDEVYLHPVFLPNSDAKIAETSINAPQPDSVMFARAKAMQEDLAVIQKKLAALPQNRDWKSIFESAKAKTQLPVVKEGGKEYFLMDTPEGFFSLLKDAKFPDYLNAKDNCAGLIALNQYLKFHNVNLIVAFVPRSDVIAARRMFPEMRDFESQKLLAKWQMLLSKDVEIVDVTDQILAHRNGSELLFFYPAGDHHPHIGTIKILAEELEKRLQRYHFPKSGDKFERDCIPFPSYSQFAKKHMGNFRCNLQLCAKMNARKYEAKENGSPVLVVSNSMGSYPGHASLANELSVRCGFPVGAKIRTGGEINRFFINELLRNESDYLKDVSVVIYVLNDYDQELRNIQVLRDQQLKKAQCSQKRHFTPSQIVCRQDDLPPFTGDAAKQANDFVQKNSNCRILCTAWGEAKKTFSIELPPELRHPTGNLGVEIRFQRLSDGAISYIQCPAAKKEIQIYNRDISVFFELTPDQLKNPTLEFVLRSFWSSEKHPCMIGISDIVVYSN